MNLIKICVWTCDMTSRSYFDKMNSTLRSIVPLAIFFINSECDVMCMFATGQMEMEIFQELGW